MTNNKSIDARGPVFKTTAEKMLCIGTTAGPTLDEGAQHVILSPHHLRMPFEIGQHDRITVCCFVLSSHCFMFDEQMGRISKSLASCPEDFIALTQKIVQMLC